MDDTLLIDTIQTASGHRFGRATLNAPAKLNALTLAMIDRLDPQLAAWAEDPMIVGVVLDGAGERAFCAGGDVVSVHHAIRATAPGHIPQLASDFFEREYRLDYNLHTFPKPLLCWGDGIVMGGGTGLLAGASHRVVTPATRMAMPEISIGLFPDVAGSWFLSRMPGRVGLFLALTGAPLNAADAVFTGLADFVAPHKSLTSILESVAAARWHGDRDTDSAQLSHLLARLSVDDLPPSNVRARLDTINETIGLDRLEDVAVRLAALADADDPWLAHAGVTFVKGSPTSAALSFELQRRARHLSLADVFRLEYQAAVGCCLHHDFAEGVRAALVDKDRRPRWQPATLTDVSSEWIDAHLQPRFAGPHPLSDLV